MGFHAGKIGDSKMTEEVIEVEETVADTAEVKTESVAEPEVTEQETEPEKIPEKVYTKSELDEIMTRRVAREKRKLQREFESKQPKAEREKTQGEPNIDDYEDTTEWIKDRTDWAATNAAKKERASYEQSTQEKAAEKVNAEYQKQQNASAAKHSDYWDAMEALEDYGEIPGYLNESVVMSDIAGELSYFLGKNPDELDRLLELTPNAAVKAVARLEDKLSATTKKEVSKVPAPTPKVNTSGKAESLEYKKDMTFEDFKKLRNNQLGRIY